MHRRFLCILAAASFAGHAVAGSVDLPVQVGGGYSVPVASIKELRFRSTVRQRYDFSCGSAALATLLTHHYGFPVAEDAVFAAMYEAGDRAKIQQEGFSLLDLKLFLEARGFSADGFDASLDRLESAGIPAIVLLRENGYSHFVVVKGVRDGRVLLGDPTSGTRVVTRTRFESLQVDRILFVIRRPEEARFNLASDWRAAPGAPVVDSLRDGVSATSLMKHGPSDF